MMENSVGVNDPVGVNSRRNVRQGDLELWDGSRLREVRTARGVSVKDLAERAGVSRGFVQDLERNHVTSPSIIHVLKVCRGLNVPISWVVGERDDESQFQAGYAAAMIDMQDAIYRLRNEHEGGE